MPQGSAIRSLLADATHAARLRFWIVIVGVLVIVLFVGSSAYDSWRSYRHVITATNRELNNLAKVLAQQADDTLQTSDLLLRDTVGWYQHERPKTDSVAERRLAAGTAGLPQVRVVVIADEHGRVRFRSEKPGSTGGDLSHRDYFIAHRDQPNLGVVLSDLLFTRAEHHPTFVLSRRLAKPDGSFDGIVQVTVELEDFQRVYQKIDLGPGSAINLLRDDGTLAVRQPAPPAAQAIGSKFPELVAAASSPDGLVTESVDRKPRFVGLAQVAAFPLVVAITRDKSIAFAGWRADYYRVAARNLVFVLLCGSAIGAVVYQLRRIELGERALRESEGHYALAMEGANEGHFDWDFEHGRSFLSPKMKLLHGRSADAPVTTRDAWLAALEVHPDDAARMQAAVRDHFEGRSDHYEADYRVRHPDGQWHWLHARGRCFRDESGKVLHFVGSAIDISERKNAEAEKERLEIQLRRSQKMEAMGTLAGGIAHDFNNILGAILGYGELAQKAAPEVVRRYLDQVMHAGGRAKALVERILAFSRSGVGERGPINVQAVIEETLELLAASLPPGIRLDKRLEAGDAAIVGDATQLHQVAMNLGTNALQAMGNGGVLEVTLERAEVAQARALSHGNLAPGPYVRLTVSDTGSGIPPQVLERIFDPFFTTKGVGEGTGLGLSLVHGIVADLGGAIDVRTAIGRGTTFTIWLPVSGEAAAPADEVDAQLPLGEGQAVMIVDDEKPLVALAEEILAKLGYEPIGFSSSVAALQAFREAPQRFDVVLTDETMPEMVGTDLARQIRRLRPDIPIVLMSGYSGAQLHERAGAVGIREVLRKPLQTGDIAECLGRVFITGETPAGRHEIDARP